MPVLSFKSQFVDPIREGSKTQTIRAVRKYPIVAGDRLYLYTALRTKYSQKIGEAECTDCRAITITRIGIHIKNGRTICSRYDLDQFAKSDGFESWEAMKQFWLDTHSLPFTGVLIKWSGFVPAPKESEAVNA